MCTFCHEKFLCAFFEMIDKFISQKFHTIWLYIYSSIKRLIFGRLMEDGEDLILRSVKSLKQRPTMILHLCSACTRPQWSSSSGIFQYRMNETREDITCPGLEGGREVTVNSTHAAAKWLLWWGGAMDWPCTRSDP